MSKSKAVKLFKREIKPVKRGIYGSFLSGAVSVPVIMLHVIAALLPVIIWAVYLFGLRVLSVIVCTVSASVGTEALITLILYKKPRVNDLTTEDVTSISAIFSCCSIICFCRF